MPEAHAARRDRLWERVAAADVDALLVTRLVNVRYLTGFTGSNGALLLTAAGAVLAVDGRYTTQAAAQAPDVEALTVPGVAAGLVARAGSAGVARLGFEPHDMTVAAHGTLTNGAPDVAFQPTTLLVEALRITKDDDEIALIRAACAAADAGLADLIAAGGLRPGRTEKEVRDDLETRMRDNGADAPSFDTIVASGPNSAVPHHRPTDRALERGDLVKLDFGALVGGYHSDMTRTVCLGEPADWQRELHALVLAAQAAGIAALTAGASTGDLDRAARDVIVDAGHGADYPHSLGHGVGLEIHEAPTLRAGGADTLCDATPVTVEPGVYLPGRGGVRIEDLLVVRPDGPESLTTTTRELLAL